MPLNDPRLICPACGKLVEIEAGRFDDLFEEPLNPDDEVAAAYHGSCGPQTKEEWGEQNPPDESVVWKAYVLDDGKPQEPQRP